MKCARDTAITLGLFLTVIIATSGILIDNSIKANAEIKEIKTEYDSRYLELKTDLKDDINEIKGDIKSIKNYLNVP